MDFNYLEPYKNQSIITPILQAFPIIILSLQR